jgi:hypothetical protein
MGAVKNLFEEVKFGIWLAFHPNWWYQQGSQSEEWDIMLNELMDEHDFTDIDTYTAKMNGVTIWIANNPYASFHPYSFRTYSSTYKLMPRRKTVLRATKKLQEDQMKPLKRKSFDQIIQEAKESK